MEVSKHKTKGIKMTITNKQAKKISELFNSVTVCLTHINTNELGYEDFMQWAKWHNEACQELLDDHKITVVQFQI
jgi:hypothetical protein